MSETTRHLVISGRVQGVSYRAWLQREAQKLGLRGWARNRSEGTVEAVLQGTSEKVSAMIDKAHKGPMLAKVDNIAISDAQDGPFNGFEIKATK